MSFRDLIIMVLDDSPHMQTIFKAVLKSFEFREVVDVRSAGDAFSAMREYRPHLAIVDLKLGDGDEINGIEFIRRLRNSKDSPNRYMPVIVCSAHADIPTVIACRNTGAMEFIAKPVSPAALYKRLVHVVNNPRPFVDVQTYFGPCRRRKFDDEYDGPDRRESDEAGRSELRL